MSRVTRRLAAFALEMAPPKIYVTYAVLWVLGLRGALLLADGAGPLVLSWALAGDIVTVVLLLLYLRAVDEQKDLEYDRVHNPGRPLVRGSITVGELRIGMVLAVAIVIALNAARGWQLAALVVVVLLYALLLVALERVSRTFRDSLFLNLAVTYPVQLLIMAFLVASYHEDTGRPVTWAAIPVAAIFVCAFLHFEFARKTSWDRRPGEGYYSNVLGPLRSGAVTVTLAIAAGVLAVAIAHPWRSSSSPVLSTCLPLVAYAFLMAGARPFFRRLVTAWSRTQAMRFLASLYLLIFVEAVAVLSLRWGHPAL